FLDLRRGGLAEQFLGSGEVVSLFFGHGDPVPRLRDASGDLFRVLLRDGVRDALTHRAELLLDEVELSTESTVVALCALVEEAVDALDEAAAESVAVLGEELLSLFGLVGVDIEESADALEDRSDVRLGVAEGGAQVGKISEEGILVATAALGELLDQLA